MNSVIIPARAGRIANCAGRTIGPDTSNVDVPIRGDSAGLQWAVFNPDGFASFTEDDANLGFGSVSFSAMTFTNVTGVGFIGNSARSSFSRFEMDKFQASMFLDTSRPGIFVNCRRGKPPFPGATSSGMAAMESGEGETSHTL